MSVHPLCMSVLSLAPFFPLAAEVSGVLPALASTLLPAVCLWHPSSSYLEQGMLLCREGTDPLSFQPPGFLQNFCAYSSCKIQMYPSDLVWVAAFLTPGFSTEHSVHLGEIKVPSCSTLHSPACWAGLYFPITPLVRWVQQALPVGIFIFLQHLAFAARHSLMKRWPKSTDWQLNLP